MAQAADSPADTHQTLGVTVPAQDEPLPVPSELATAVASAVSTFGAAVGPRLASGAGEPEDQMRGPLETLLAQVAAAVGVRFTVVGEASLADLRVRPDYAAYVNGAITGYIEVKAPGKGADPTRWSARSHDGVQWSKLSALPNVLYTDGENWGLYRTGVKVGDVVRLRGDIATARARLTPDGDGLARLLADFLHWTPVAPRSLSQLVGAVAPLTRLLRDEVIDTLARENGSGGGPFTALASDWRGLLFPDATDFEFADGYAQSVTFALLLARTEQIAFGGQNVDQIARTLGRTHSLLGKALSVLTDDTIGALSVTLGTLVRVISVVDFARFATHIADPYLALYEHFLAEYDPVLRQQTGSYYTPAPVVAAMTRLVDQVLRSRLGRAHGLADDDVVVVDPAMGTGAFVLDVLETVAETVRTYEGPGAVPARLTSTASRLVGIEKQTGPFAVAEMRVNEALRRHGAHAPQGGLRLYVADTLDNPYAEETHLAATLEPIAVSRRKANQMKKAEQVLVMLGNPPYRERARGDGGFIETGAPGIEEWAAPLLDAFREPGNGQAEYVLSNLYVFFWRFACWKVFDAHPAHPDGVICFITTAGYLKGPGFAGMRRYLREHASEGWIIDGTPEGHQPEVATRIFGGVQQPVAIGLFAKRANNDPQVPATVHYRALHGRQAAKFDELKSLDLDGDGWEDCPDGWTEPFLPESGSVWASSPLVGDLLPWHSPGVKPNRTWVYAPLPDTLRRRWAALVDAPPSQKPAMFRESRDATLSRRKPGLPGFPHADRPVADESGVPLDPVPVAYRSFDTQHVIPDDRVLATPRADLWRVRGGHQVHVTEQHDQPIRSGPALTFAADTPDMHHYNGRGGRVLPLYVGPDRSDPNLAPGLTALLTARLGTAVTPEDVLAYIAAVTAQPAFTERFADDLRTPGIRVPLTADPGLWQQAVGLGRRVLWLHTRGRRYTDPAAGRPPGPPTVEDPARRPLLVEPIPDAAGQLPDELAYDEDTRTLSVGGGRITPVAPEVVAYQVAGMNVLRKWFGYRKASRPQARGEQSPLDDVRPAAWPPAYTTDLLELLHTLTLVTDLEDGQAALLNDVLAAELVTVDELTAAGVMPPPAAARLSPQRRRPPADTNQGTLL